MSPRILIPIVTAIFFVGCSNSKFSQTSFLVYEVSTPNSSSQLDDSLLETSGTPAPTLNLSIGDAIASSNTRFQIARKDEGEKGEVDVKIIEHIKETLAKHGAKEYEITVFDVDQNSIFSESGNSPQ